MRHHGFDPVGRVFGVERQVRGAGREHRVHSHDHLDAAVQAHPDRGLRTGTAGDELARQPVHLIVELGVSDGAVAEFECDGVRAAAHLVGEQRHQRAGGHRHLGGVPFPQHPVLLGVGDGRQFAGGRGRLGGQEAGEEVEVAAVVRGDFGFAVELGIGFEVEMGAAAVTVVDVDREVLDGARREHVQLAGDVTELQLVVEQHDVDHRSEEAAGVAGVAAVAPDVVGAVALVA
ncbi:hypothetical protein GCM10011610_01930 [Nocardia rhizosphaerihabitans]|uniref:Uncharacterized protein n=1 Tax=Nocardia rhizosphaerihabitans TaxID=1691570 RepID=A0ABQ2K2W4_9NOCA|nr:hypothetical protein GCM10011610_01930 [Nocardia rhizosphaerihabitans]